MEYRDREKIDYLCSELLQDLDINKLWPKLLENQVYNRDDVNIPNWQKNLTSIDTIYDICSTIQTRGPYAYKNLILSLRQSGHQTLADTLETDGSINSNFNSNNNRESNPGSSSNSHELLNNSTEISNNSNNDEHSTDDFYTKILTELDPLIIKVRKAKVFKDNPDFKDIENYPMRSSPRGLVLLITNIEYEMVENRLSAEYDEKNLKQLFEEMGFKVILHRNLPGREIKKKVKEFSEMKELRRVDCAFIIISSHGSGEHGKQETEIQGTDYKKPDYEPVFCVDIIDCFNAEQCPTFEIKPKIFIFQTCSDINYQTIQRCSRVPHNSIKSNNLSTFSSKSTRGDEHQIAVTRNQTDSAINDPGPSDTNKAYFLAPRKYGNTLIAYSTVPGYVSFRDKFLGSWFIQILCEVFMNYAYKSHVQDLFNMIDSRLKHLRTADNGCQTLWVVNKGFHKHCYLNPGLFPKPSGSK